jgi:predicted DNA-binding transcriptional regulator AlpA
MTTELANFQPATLTRRHLAEYLQCSVSSIDRDDAAGLLPRAIKRGQRKRWLRDTIDRWLLAGAPDRSIWEAMEAQRRR